EINYPISKISLNDDSDSFVFYNQTDDIITSENKLVFCSLLRKKIISSNLDTKEYNLDVGYYKDTTTIMLQDWTDRLQRFESEDESSCFIGLGEWFIKNELT
ncbi:hypothetical protein HOK00_00765, partial [bacterium]|nr:hypothetical protein [bacterium]